jgi:hypothetical protein
VPCWAKREELEFEMSTLKQVDPIEAMQLGNGIINQVKERMSKRV